MRSPIFIDYYSGHPTSLTAPMSNHYTTKALGRPWAPSPTHYSPRRVSSQTRFGPARYVKFLDMPKSWVASNEGLKEEGMPKCREAAGGTNCDDRDGWVGVV